MLSPLPDESVAKGIHSAIGAIGLNSVRSSEILPPSPSKQAMVSSSEKFMSINLDLSACTVITHGLTSRPVALSILSIVPFRATEFNALAASD